MFEGNLLHRKTRNFLDLAASFATSNMKLLMRFETLALSTVEILWDGGGIRV